MSRVLVMILPGWDQEVVISLEEGQEVWSTLDGVEVFDADDKTVAVAINPTFWWVRDVADEPAEEQETLF